MMLILLYSSTSCWQLPRRMCGPSHPLPPSPQVASVVLPLAGVTMRVELGDNLEFLPLRSLLKGKKKKQPIYSHLE